MFVSLSNLQNVLQDDPDAMEPYRIFVSAKILQFTLALFNSAS